MEETEIKEIMGRVRAALEGEKSPSEATKNDLLRLAEGTLINLARVAAHASRKAKG